MPRPDGIVHHGGYGSQFEAGATSPPTRRGRLRRTPAVAGVTFVKIT